jgi:hypothetical protein
MFGAAWQVDFTASSNKDVYFQQNVPLPRDESGDAIRSQLCFSIHARFTSSLLTTSLLNTANLSIDWLDASQSFISTTGSGNFLDLEYTAEYKRYWIFGTPPANAFYAFIYVHVHIAGVATTSFIRFSGAQLEYTTFAKVYLNNPGVPLRNPIMASHGGGSQVDDWGGNTNGGSGGAFNVVTSPSLYGQAAQIAFTNATQDYLWEQARIPINPNAAYTATMTYQITVALSANVWEFFQIQYFDSNGSFIDEAYSEGIHAEAVSTGWLQNVINFGLGTSFPMPANTASIKVQGALHSPGGTNSGTLVIGSITVTPFPLALQLAPTLTIQTALEAGVYPTPYCDNGTTGGAQSGCYTDGITGFYFRELRLFGGFIRTPQYDYTGAEPESDLTLQATEYGILMQEAPCNLVVRAQADNAAIAAIFTYASTQGFLEGCDFSTFVQNIDTIDAKVFNWATVRDAVMGIASDTVAAVYMDYYKRLHYAPALATIASFALSDTPDFISTFPMEQWKYTDDSTQSVTTPVVEGTVQPSAPQTFNATGNGATTAYTLNGGNAVQQVTSCTVNGVVKKVGIVNVNAFADGYDALLDVTKGILTFASAPGNTLAIVVLYWFYAPVIVRLHDPAAESKTASMPFITTRHHALVLRIRRKIHIHTQDKTLDSKASAIDAANATLTVFGQPRPVATLRVRTPPVPVAVDLRPGMAIPITHAISGLSGTLFQVQEVTLKPMGNGQIIKELKVGHYRPTFIVMMAHRHRAIQQTDEFSGTPLLDVLTLSDGWAITDSVSHAVQNVGQWGGSTSSTWNGTYVWG